MYNIVKRGHSYAKMATVLVREVSNATQAGLFSKVMTYISEGGFIWIQTKVRESTITTSFRCPPFISAVRQANSSEELPQLAGSLTAQRGLPSTTNFSALDRCRVSSFSHVSPSLLDRHFYTERTSADSASTWQESLKHLKTSAPDARLAMFRMHFLTHANACRWLIGWDWPQPPGL